MARHEQEASQSTLPQPLRSAATVLQRVPGAGLVSRAAGGALDKVGAVSPRGRRLAVYTGAGVLGVAGIVEWPVAVTGAAVAWLTQPRPHEREHAEEVSEIPPGAAPAEGEPETPPADEVGEVRETPPGDVGTTPGLELGTRPGFGLGGALDGGDPVTVESGPLSGPEAPEPGAAEPSTDSEEDGSGTAPSGPAIS
jgi:hypothetical protein